MSRSTTKKQETKYRGNLIYTGHLQFDWMIRNWVFNVNSQKMCTRALIKYANKLVFLLDFDSRFQRLRIESTTVAHIISHSDLYSVAEEVFSTRLKLINSYFVSFYIFLQFSRNLKSFNIQYISPALEEVKPRIQRFLTQFK